LKLRPIRSIHGKPVLGLLVLFVLVTTGLGAANLPVQRFALFVGANQGGPARQPLRYAQKDALKVQQVMQEVGGVAPADRILLLDPSHQEIQKALAALASLMESSGKTGLRRTEFLFYYSGHSDENGMLLGSESFSYKELREGLAAIPADIRIAILDSCSSGAFAQIKGGTLRAPFLDQDSSQMKGHAFLTSSSNTEASQESDALEGSFFTHYLVSGLRGGADNFGDGRITLNEAYAYAYQNTLARTESTRAGPQHPSYEIQLSGTGDLVLSDLQEANSRLEVAGELAGRVYVRSEAGQLFAEVLKGAGAPLVLVFPPGAYTCAVVTPRQVLSARVSLGPQGTVKLVPQDFQARNLDQFALRGPGESQDGTPVGEERFSSLLSTLSLGLVPSPPYTDQSWEDKVFGISLVVDKAGALRGFQASGLVSFDAASLAGVQLGGLGTLSHGPATGVQASGFFNVAENGLLGLQSTGGINLTGGPSNAGAQFAGTLNFSQGVFRGVQSAPVNITGSLIGVQFGTVNLSHGVNGAQFAVGNVAGDFNGAQFGVVNVTGVFNGVQVGLVNINTGFHGLGIGLVNVGPDAYYRPTVLFDNQGKTTTLVQWGMGPVYLVNGVRVEATTVVGTGAFEHFGGLGVELNPGVFFWDTDAGVTQSQQAAGQSLPQPYLRSLVGHRFGWVSLEAGVLSSFNVMDYRWETNPLGFSLPSQFFAGVRFL